jgi:predicted transposase YbfD/YdcC
MPKLLEILSLENSILTNNAMGYQRTIAEKIIKNRQTM